MFGVGKRDSTKVREVWHGSRVSDAAIRPPPPPHLASPSALLDLESSLDCPVRLSKRDGRCLFDQLRLPPDLERFMGRPPVRVRELLSAGLSGSELRRCCSDPGGMTEGRLVYPASRSWPMGFSWSSYVAQCTMLYGVCRRAGLCVQQILAGDRASPLDLQNTFALATDDILCFTRGSLALAAAVTSKVDRAFDSVGVVRNPAKDVDGALSETCIGIDLEQGIRLAANAGKLAVVLPALVELLSVRQVAPLGLAGLLGVVQWFNQLARPLFSVLDTVYEFERRAGPRTRQELSDCHLSELLVVLALAPLWEADLTRPWLPQLVASDASTSFGFGACAAPCPPDVARRIGRLSEKRGDYIRLARAGDTDDEPERDRIGAPHRLHLPKGAFSTILSQRCHYAASPGELEAAGLVLLLRWLCRSARKHGHRVVILVDAKAVLGAAAKGRSSAPSFKRHARRLAALTLAGGFLARYVYVPSEDNPADAPSRGVVRSKPRVDIQRARL